MPVEAVKVELKPKLASEKSDYQLIRDDIISVEPVSVELKWGMSDEEFNEYNEVVSETIGSNREFQDELLRRFLKENNILVYSPENVIRLLRHKSKKHLMRPKFVFLSNSKGTQELLKTLSSVSFGGLGIIEKVFSDFIPLRVVKKINLVLKQFPELYCFVSDSEVCLEIFIAVAFGKDSEVFVIDMWNKDESGLVRREE